MGVKRNFTVMSAQARAVQEWVTSWEELCWGEKTSTVEGCSRLGSPGWDEVHLQVDHRFQVIFL